MNYVYILECNDGTLYTGWTKNLNERIVCHNKGTGAKYTKTRLPVELKYFECFENKIEAQKREYQIKRLSRIKKMELISRGCLLVSMDK